LRHLRSGRLELIAVGALGNHAVVDLLAQMVREIPALAVSLSVTVERDVPGWLANSRADWALCMMPVDRPDIHCEPLVRFEACCVMATTHRLALQSVVCPEDLEGESFISFRSDGRLRQTIDGLFVSRGVQRRLQFEVYGSEQACALAAKGVGVALVEPLSASRHVALGHVAMRRFEPAIVYTVYLLRHRQRPISRVASRFAELLRQQLPGLLTDRGAHLLDG
jgi:DNA-binding transcriptional LysR family regulator